MLSPVGFKRERRAGRALVAAYHEARLAELVEHAADAVDRFRAGEQDACDVDDVLHQYPNGRLADDSTEHECALIRQFGR